MKATVDTFKNLVITADAEDRSALAERREDEGFESDSFLYDFFGPLVSNSEYDWCQPEEIGALTSAPILCKRNSFGDVVEAWGFMDYQVISVQRQLLEHGQAIFQHG